MGADMATEPLAILIVLVAAVFGALGAIYLKKGSKKIFNIFNFKAYFGILLYVLSSLLFIYALKDGDLSVLTPISGTSYVWVSLLSIKMLKENMNKYKWLGIFTIIIGVSLLAIGSQ